MRAAGGIVGVLAVAALMWSAAAAEADGGVVDVRTKTDLRIVGADAGRVVAPAGDVNGDRTEDLLVSAGARVYVMFGPFSSGQIDLDTLSSGGYRIDAGETVYSAAGIGDMNGDGRDDIIVGVPGRDNGTQPDVGSAYVVFGKASWAPVSLASLGAQGFRMDGQFAYGLAGASVSGAGDVNGDGRPDVIVGAYPANRAYVVFGKATTDNVALASAGNWGFQITDSGHIDFLGASVLGVEDMNGDGLDDVAVGGPRACRTAAACDGHGAVWVIWGKQSTATIDVASLGTQGFRIFGRNSSLPALAGGHIALAGDMNADGLQDVLISADYGGSAAFVVWGKATNTPIYLDALGNAGFETIGPGACCELALAGNRDLNADGRPDVLIGLPENAQPGRDTDRAAWAIFGAPSGNTVTLGVGAPHTLLYDGIPEYSRRNLSVATMDLNLDGRSDVLIGTPDEFRGAPDYEYGIVRAVFSRPLPPYAMSLAPAAATNDAGQEHCVTAALTDTASAPATDFLVRFDVTGANAASGSVRSDAEGRARFCYTGTHAGEDAISAYADSNEDGVKDDEIEPEATARKTYRPARPAALSLSPPSDENPIDTTHCVTATVTDEFGNSITGGDVRFSVSGGRAGNTASGSQPVSGGTATFCYAGPALGPSTDTIIAYHDTDGDGVADAGEPAGTASKDWALPGTSNGCRVSGAGRARTDTGRKVNFRLDARAVAGAVSGSFRHEEHGRGSSARIRSSHLAALSCGPDGATASLFGEGSYNGRGRLLLRVDLTDAGGNGRDSYRVRLSSGFDAGAVQVLSGDIAISP